MSRAVAGRLGLNYLDTGAMYRAMTWAILQAGIDPENATEVAGIVTSNKPPRLVSGTDPHNPTIEVDGVDVAEPIRGATVTNVVSAVSAVPAIRENLVDLQRSYVAESEAGIVVEGRDIGSVVLPDAHLKVFLTADPSVRAQRRAAEQRDDHDASHAATESALLTRDAKDSTRSVSPLTRADGAVEIDTTHLSFEEVVDAVLNLAGQVSRT